MSDDIAHILLTALIIVPLAALVFILMNALRAAWQLQTILLSLPF